MLHNDPYSEYNYYGSQVYVQAASPGPNTVQFVHTYVNRVGGAVVSWLVCPSPERAVWARGPGQDVGVFLGKTLNSHSATPHPGV